VSDAQAQWGLLFSLLFLGWPILGWPFFKPTLLGTNTTVIVPYRHDINLHINFHKTHHKILIGKYIVML